MDLACILALFFAGLIGFFLGRAYDREPHI
jgi:hypothetical protein